MNGCGRVCEIKARHSRKDERMTVQELIAALQKQDPGATVIVSLNGDNSQFGAELVIVPMMVNARGALTNAVLLSAAASHEGRCQIKLLAVPAV